MEQETTKVIRIVVDSSKAVDGGRDVQRALEGIEKQTASVSASLDKMQDTLDTGALITKLVAGAFTIKEFADRILGIYKAAQDAASAISDFSQQLGVSTDFVQASTFAAAENTVGVDKMQQGFTKASQLIGQAAQGQKAAIDVFKNLGVYLLDASGKLRSTESVLQDAAIAILKIDDPAKRVAASIDLFGKQGQQLIPMLQSLAEGAGAMEVRARAAGAVMDKETIEALSRLKAKSEETAQKWTVLTATLAAPIATTALDNFGKFLDDVIDKMKRANGSWSQFLTNAVEASRKEGRIAGMRLMTDKELADDRADQIAKEKAANQNNPAYEGRGGLVEDDAARYARDQVNDALNRQASMQDDESRARSAPLPVVDGAPGRGNPTDRAGGESLAQRIKKLTDTANAAAKAQDEMTAAARRGDVAFMEQQAAAEATAKAIEAFGGTLKATDPQVRALADTLRQPIFDKLQGQAAQNFAVATTELQKQNELLTVQIATMNQAPEIQAREIALVKSRQEAEKAGNALTAQDIDNRRKAIEQNETLKIQAEQIKQANELMLEPIKQGLRDIQNIGANVWEQILTNGTFSAQAIGQAFVTAARRAAAEFLALMTFRPLMSMFVQGATSAGFITPAMAGSLGYPVGAGSAAGGSSGWLDRPVFGVTPTPEGGFANVGDLIASGQTGASLNAGGAFTWGNAMTGVASVASIAAGAYGLANSKGVGSAVSGASGVLGGALGLASLIPGMQFLAPIAMGVGLGGSLLGGLLGDDGPKTPPQPALVYNYGAFTGNSMGRFTGAGSTGAGSVGTQVSRLFRSAGLTTVPGALFGGELATGTDHMLQGGQWQDRPYTQVGLINPQGGLERITYNDASRNPQQAADLLAASVFSANVLRGGVTGASDALKAGLRSYSPQTVQDVQNVVDLAKAYDQLGKATDPAKESIDKLAASFDDLSDFATKAGLDLAPVAAELQKQTKRTAQDFIDSMLDPLAVQLRALDDERQSAIASAEYIKDHIEGVYVDMDRIATYYTNKEAALRDQFYQGSISSLQNLINRLTYGDLGNASPTTALAGSRAAYTAGLAQAMTLDPTAVSNFSGLAESYAQAGRTNFASGPGYEAIRAQIIRDLATVSSAASGGAGQASGDPANLNDAGAAMVGQVVQLTNLVQQQAQQINDLREMYAADLAARRAQTSSRI